MPANPRQLCIRALLEWEKGKVFSDEILHTLLEKERLAPLDRAFLMETFFGVPRNQTALDFLIGQLREGAGNSAHSTASGENARLRDMAMLHSPP